MRMDRRKRWTAVRVLVAGGTLCYGALLGRAVTVSGDSGPGKGGVNVGAATQFSLAGKRPTDPADLANYVKNRAAAIRLGKALFWDQQAGGDGVQACASCHFNAGADTRLKNSVNPHNATFTKGPNATLVAADFPFHLLSDVNNRASAVVRDTDDISGSQGVFLRTFVQIGFGSPASDTCTSVPDATFNVGGTNVRRVTGRNAPTNINAAFNFRNFWDGRAREVFNGVDPHGADTVGAVIFRTVGGVPTPVSVLIANSSAASQAVGPPNNGTEMSCDGRSFPLLGRKMMNLIPLNGQTVSPTDGVLGGLANPTGTGLNATYVGMIQDAFQNDLWNGGVTQMENNFSLYWGLSIQLYEDTLTSDNAPIDQFAAGNAAALSASAQRGLGVFTGKGRCSTCHSGPLFTAAVAVGGRSFSNTGVRPVADDAGGILEGNGRFKVPTLRNVELTGPYFHNGGQATLAQVVDFYNRGADFAGGFTDGNVRPLGLTSVEKADLVNFMLSLTDNRVRTRQAPFDSPSLCVPDDGLSDGVTNAICIPAVGAAGGAPAAAFQP
ncbi:MAG: cytochrome-c peroxidase [Acidobacteria bacterium]|nr:MAG: cytochrome-c peroxidase [Acidobacteriota bacterium]